MPLQELTGRFAVERVIETNGVTAWESPGRSVRFFEDSRRLELNGTLLWMNGAITTNATAQRMISLADVNTILVPLLSPPVPSRMPGRRLVILDPGHGGADPGAVIAGAVDEKTLTLDVARRVRLELENAGFDVRLTRRRDLTLSLAERTAFARRRRGAVMVSIHANKASNAQARGIETFVLPAAGFPSTSGTEPVPDAHPGNRFDAASTQLAYFIHREVVGRAQAVDRGVKRARFEVLRNAPCPAALVEIGFMSNAAELKQLRDPDYRDRLADGIASGIVLFMHSAWAER